MATATHQPRLASLDQFRGYTVAGMFLVNYLGDFLYCPFVLRHHNTYCSYADTIMPEFFFAVGFAFRLSFGRREHQQGLGKAYWHMVKRLVGLAIVAMIVYNARPHLPEGATFNWETIKTLGVWNLLHDPLKRDWFQTLMHIAVTSLWILPVIRAGALVRILYMVGSALLHLWLSHAFYFYWVNGVPDGPSGIDGGPLGFLTWTIPTMVGTLACDVVMSPKSRGMMVAKLIGWGVVLTALGWIASCGTRMYDVPAGQVEALAKDKLAEHPVFPSKTKFDHWMANLKAGNWPKALVEPPFVPPPHSQDPPNPEVEKKKEKKDRKLEDDNSHLYRKANYWMMSQRCGTISYLTYGAGISLLVYALFFVLADMIGLKVGVFRTLGSNALFGYVLHDIVGDKVKNFFPKDVPPTVMWLSFALYFFLCWLIIRSLEKKNIYIKL
jgi:predicted acyltransferase